MKVNSRVNYTSFNCPQGATFIQGIRGVEGSEGPEQVYIAGSLVESSELTSGLLYQGPLAFNGGEGKWNVLTFTAEGVDNVVNTSCYGPNNLPNGNVQIVGSYKVSGDSTTFGLYYEGLPDGSGKWKTVSPNNGDTENVFVHSVMRGYAVGNYDTKVYSATAFIYDVQKNTFQEIAVEGAYTTTLYGIWHNGGSSYTLAGGCSFDGPENLSQGFLVDWDSETKETSNWKMYQYLDKDLKTLITHFEGITADGNGGYNLPSDSVDFDLRNETPLQVSAAMVNIKREEDGTFSDATWIPISYPMTGAITSANTAYKNNILGVYSAGNSTGGMSEFGYNARVVGV